MHTSTVNISFPRPFLRLLSRAAKEESRSRSELLREAARQYIERKRRWSGLFSSWQKEAKAARIKPGDIDKAVAAVRRRG